MNPWSITDLKQSFPSSQVVHTTVERTWVWILNTRQLSGVARPVNQSAKGQVWASTSLCMRKRADSQEVCLCILTVLLLSVCRPSLSVSSLIAMALGKSCLFANTSKTASLSSSSWSYSFRHKQRRPKMENSNEWGTKEKQPILNYGTSTNLWRVFPLAAEVGFRSWGWCHTRLENQYGRL